MADGQDRGPGCFNYVCVDSARLLHQFLRSKVQFLSEGPTDLSNLQRVRKPIVKYLCVGRRSYLGHFGETAKRGGIENAITISLSGASIIFFRSF